MLLILLILLSTKIKAQTNSNDKSIDHIRTEFYEAVESQDVTKKLIFYIKENFTHERGNFSAKILAYYGALQTLLAKHNFNPYSKMKYVIDGVKKLSQAVDISGEDLEIRFLRFAVLHNIPGIFGISDEREDDKNKIHELLVKGNVNDLDESIQTGIIEFMLESKRLNEGQKNELLNLHNHYSRK